MKIQELIQKLQLANNQSKRIDCLCGGKNTLSISKIRGTIKWHCFRASCNIKGIRDTNLSLEYMKQPRIRLCPHDTNLLVKDCLGWKPCINHKPALSYLLKNNCYDAFAESPNNFYYDCIRDRVVFVNWFDKKSFSLAIGRSIRYSRMKWYKYVCMNNVYYTAFCLDKNIKHSCAAYIVEDCASACSLSRLGHGIALCGTTWKTDALVNKIAELGVLDVVICLDKDAQEKSLKLKVDLEGFGKFRSVKVIQLSDDSKYIGLEQLKKEIENVGCAAN